MGILGSDATPLGRAASVVGDGCDVGDGGDLETGRLERADRLLAPRARTLHVDLDLAHAVLHRTAGGAIGSERGRVRRALPRALEAGHPGRAPRDDVAGLVRDRDDRVVERRQDGDVPLGEFLSLAAPLLDGALSVGHAFGVPCLLLAPRADRLLRSAPLACVGLGARAANREVAAVTEPAIRADLDETLDVERDLATEIAFDGQPAVDDLAETTDLLLGEIADTRVRVHVRLLEDLLARREPDPVDVRERDLDPLLAGDVDAGDACHPISPAAACAWGSSR